MARNTLKLDTKPFYKLLAQIDHMGGNVREAVENALGQASETIRDDTLEYVSSSYLPRQGKFSQGDTAEAVIMDNHVRWQGNIGWVPIGFDFQEPGAGGYLITGTPRMEPDYMLRKMYKQKRYMRQIQEDISDVLLDYVIEAK